MCLFHFHPLLNPPKTRAHWAVINPSSIHQLLPCRMEERCSRVTTNTHTFIYSWEGLQSSNPLNLRLALVWTLREGRSAWARCLSLPPPPSLVTPSLHPLLFHNAEVGRLLPSKDHAVTTLKHTHIYTHLEPKLVSPGTCANSLTDWPTISPRVTWSCVGSVCFPVVEMMLIHVNN